MRLETVLRRSSKYMQYDMSMWLAGTRLDIWIERAVTQGIFFLQRNGVLSWKLQEKYYH